MRKALPCVLTALAVVVLPQALAAQEAKRPGRPGPEMLFKRLDANQDGAISADEVPDGVPEPIKQALIRADQNKDKRVTAEEFKEAVKRHHGGSPHGRSPQRPGVPQAGPPKGFTPGILFQRLDANKDGAVSAAEVPDGAPEAIKQMLVKADRNKDKKVTPKEFREAVRRHPAAAPQRRPGPSGAGSRQGPPHGKHPSRGRGHYDKHGPRDGRPHHGPPSAGRPSGPQIPDPKELFFRMDRNKDKRLSLEEFAEGMKRVHQAMAARRPGGAQKPPYGQRPGGHKPPFAGRPGMGHAPAGQRMAMIGRGIFEKADRNKDGKISIDEVPEQRREGFKKVLAKADKDGDKALSGEEAKAVAAAVAQRVRSQAAGKVGEIGKKIFVKLDADKDGKITLAEVPQQRREGFKRLLAKADKDGDKALSGEEAKRVVGYISQRIRSGQGQPGRPPLARPPGQRPERFRPDPQFKMPAK